MAKKTLKKKVQAKASSSKLSDQVLDSARDIWLAGLGAFSIAQQETNKLVEQGGKLVGQSGKLVEQGGKILDEGSKLFDKLGEEGSKIEKSTRDEVENKVVDIRGDVESRVDSVRQQAVDNWDKLENIFEDRVARVLGRLGVPTADDVNKLSARVQKLSEQVASISAKPAAKAAPKKAAPKKAAPKKAAPKAAAVKKGDNNPMQITPSTPILFIIFIIFNLLFYFNYLSITIY